MVRLRTALGDAHNFGRRVTREGDVVTKPRTLVWEELVLSAKSPLRRALAHAAAEDGLGDDAFDFLLDLSFGAHDPRGGGEVAAAALAPLGELTGSERAALAAVAGRALALFAWLGVADLHWENLVLGRDARGRLVFSPLDVEMILDDFELPTATKLLPDADPEVVDVCRHAAGVRRLLPFLGKPVDGATLVAAAAAYHATLACLARHAAPIAAAIAGAEGALEAPIRVCLRSTAEYVLAGAPGAEPPWPPFLPAEEEQMARGDVPYFFRLLGRPGLHWYADASLTDVRTLPSKGDVPQLAPLLPLAPGKRALRSKRRETLGVQGLFTVLGAFDHRGLEGTHEASGLTVRFARRALVVTLPDGEELEARRDLGDHVASVYLPCTCGEVAAPFVPAVTRCDGGAGAARAR